MKYAILLFAIVFHVSSYSQANDSLSYRKATVFTNYKRIDSLFKSRQNFSFKLKASDFSYITIYNQSTQSDDIYYLSKYSADYSKSVYTNNNQFVRKDSFNPYGTSNVGLGTIMGGLSNVLSFTLFKL